ncbi:MAG TPA: hypothetical protein VEY91_01580, partial [Candidatus Limnocylindria bacterium]|nr:hypothetical protein [Candidatus Limnocylindria bacterium]
MRRAFAPALLATLLFAQWLLASHAVAHDQPYTFLDLRLEPTRLEGALTAHVFDLAHEIGLASPDTLLAGALAAGRADTLR